MAAPGYESNRFRIIISWWAAGPAPVLTESWDRFPWRQLTRFESALADSRYVRPTNVPGTAGWGKLRPAEPARALGRNTQFY